MYESPRREVSANRESECEKNELSIRAILDPHRMLKSGRILDM